MNLLKTLVLSASLSGLAGCCNPDMIKEEAARDFSRYIEQSKGEERFELEKEEQDINIPINVKEFIEILAKEHDKFHEKYTFSYEDIKGTYQKIDEVKRLFDYEAVK